MVSLKEFVKEKLSPNLTIENNFLSDKPDMRKMQWHEHHLSTEGRYLRMVEIGIDLFNFKAIYGISYLIFIKYLKNTPPAIAKFLHNQRSYNEKSSDYNKTIKKDKIQITSFLTNMKIKEILEVLSFFTESFIFRDMTFVCALKFFLNNFVVENDPGKIDILLYAFSRKYFKELKKIKLGSFLTQDPFKEKNFIYDNQAYVRGVFQHFDAVHMLSFATIMMDIEIHHMKRKDLDNIIKEYNLNVKGLNDGENFPKEFIDSIVENVLAQNLIVLKEIDELKEKPIINSLKQSIAKDADLFINIKKNKKNSKEIMFFNLVMVENLGFLFKNKGEENLVGLFVLENCNVKVKGINFSFVSNEKKSNKLIIYGKYCDENGIIAVKYKESLEFLLLDAADAKKIIYYVEKINKAKV